MLLLFLISLVSFAGATSYILLKNKKEYTLYPVVLLSIVGLIITVINYFIPFLGESDLALFANIIYYFTLFIAVIRTFIMIKS